MPPLPIRIPPGIVKRDSPNAALGRYTDCDKFRFNGQYPEKWGGWTSLVDCTLIGVPRGATSWANIVGQQNLAFGTAFKLYVITGGETCIDITPIRQSGTLSTDDSVTVSTTNSPKNLVTIVDSSHGLIEGAYVTFTSTTDVGGIKLNGEYQVNSVIDTNTYTVIAASTSGPTTSTNRDGAFYGYSYQINPGNPNPGYGSGWGMGIWGESTGWGLPQSTGALPVDMRHWSVEEYANNLLACPFADTIYDWDESTDDQAQIITNAPDYIRSMFVTPERYVFALGASTAPSSIINPMKVMWPDVDDITNWTPAAGNTANSRTLQNGSKLIAGCPLQDLVSLVWSDTALYVFQFVQGSELIYHSRLAGEGCGLAGPLAFVTLNGVAYWLSGTDFHVYSGSVGSVPNVGDISDYFFERVNRSQISKTWCVYNPKPNTIIWGYVSVDSTSLEPDEYVEVTVGDWSWSHGTLNRSCGTIFRPHEGSLVLADPDGQLWEHESGHDDGTEAMEAFITFGEYQLAEGEQNADIFGFIPDFQRQSGQVEVTVRTQERPNSMSTFDSQTVIIGEGDEIEDLRVSGRVFGFTVRTNEVGGDVRIGIPTLEIGADGERR